MCSLTLILLRQEEKLKQSYLVSLHPVLLDKQGKLRLSERRVTLSRSPNAVSVQAKYALMIYKCYSFALEVRCLVCLLPTEPELAERKEQAAALQLFYFVE